MLSADSLDASHVRGTPGGEHISALREETIEATRSGEHPKAAQRVADISKRVDIATGGVSDPARANLSPFAVGGNPKAGPPRSETARPRCGVRATAGRATGWRAGEPDDEIAAGLCAAELDLNRVPERVKHPPFRALHNNRLCCRCVFLLVHDVLISFALVTSCNEVRFLR